MDNKYNDYNENETTNLKLVIGLYRSYSNINRQTQKFLSEHKLTLAQFGVLEALYHLGDLKINDIIEKTLSTSGNITVVIKNLEKDQLIERYRLPSDSRVCMIRLTSEGEDLIRTVFPEHLIQLNQTLKNLDNDEKKTIMKLLKKLNGIG
jgi:MarR family 2-MHQ and catechol resistance regulon transcriptional repressor